MAQYIRRIIGFESSIDSEVKKILEENRQRGIPLTQPELKPDNTLKTAIEIFKQQCGKRQYLEQVVKTFTPMPMDQGIPGKRKKTHSFRNDFITNNVPDSLWSDVAAIVQMCLEEDRNSIFNNDVLLLRDMMMENNNKGEKWNAEVIDIFDRIYHLLRFRNETVFSNHSYDISKSFTEWKRRIKKDIDIHLNRVQFIEYDTYRERLIEYLSEIVCRDLKGHYTVLHSKQNEIIQLNWDKFPGMSDYKKRIFRKVKNIRDIISDRVPDIGKCLSLEVANLVQMIRQ